jgi:phosphatidylserine/phosphatidylglycerophosphate/cardiolipin synthase-like enzyme
MQVFQQAAGVVDVDWLEDPQAKYDLRVDLDKASLHSISAADVTRTLNRTGRRRWSSARSALPRRQSNPRAIVPFRSIWNPGLGESEAAHEWADRIARNNHAKSDNDGYERIPQELPCEEP